MNYINMTGKICGDLKVTAPSNRKSGEEWLWQCECLRCGRTVYARGTDLRAGRKVACAVCSVTEAGERRRKPKELGHEPKEDCRAYAGDRCAGLKEMLCRTRGKCNFYKSKGEA